MSLRGRHLGWLTLGDSTVSSLRHFQREGAQIGLLHSSVQLCPTLCNPMDCSPPGSSVHGTSQARILECGAISFSRGSSRTRKRTSISCVGRQVLYH